ncbi:hypothetical protein BY457_103178 [Marinilabilia salmonicolor]|jgi:hypothetical protein|uniref:DUF6057 family protein n=1 Tax=Marinilabilia salmonicolor TaxID=989 RepID=UPI000D04E9E9|nr:DUF6057 family protein [Marinilabilia salmonicolor]PRZ01363.1 hypothetical protein BY457_103178 [Marinilabilia salmonicolor]
MLKKISLSGLSSLFFGLVIFLFFGLFYAFHLHYQEQYQLFLFTAHYFFERVMQPGGLSNYLGAFFTQFYFYPWIGSFILATLLIFFQRILLGTARNLGAAKNFFVLSFFPVLMYWGLLCDENYLTGGLVAILFVSLSNYLYTFSRSGTVKILFILLGIPLLYLIAGGSVLFFFLFLLIYELNEKTRSWKFLLLFNLLGVLLILTIPFFLKNRLGMFPPVSSFLGVNYFRFPINFPVIVVVIGFLLVALPFVSKYLSSRQFPLKKSILIVQVIVFLLFGSWFIHRSVDFEREEIMEYDFYVRMRKWEEIIHKAEVKTPQSPLSVTCLNLALGKKGQLGDRMFEFFQKGDEGLIPDFVKDFTIPMVAGEVYYHLGLINTAQRFSFEAMEALPDYQKSVRTIKRLAETSLINGNYVLSKKYLKILQNTFYYRKWATYLDRAMKNEDLINQHPEYGVLRRMKLDRDFFFSDQEKDMMLGIIFSEKKSKLVFEYLMAYCLLNKDIQHFVQYFPLGETLPYFTIPRHFQEALVYAWDVSKSEVIKDIPYPINREIQSSLNKYRKVYTSQSNPQSLLRKDFGDTYWYYFHFRN